MASRGPVPCPGSIPNTYRASRLLSGALPQQAHPCRSRDAGESQVALGTFHTGNDGGSPRRRDASYFEVGKAGERRRRPFRMGDRGLFHSLFLIFIKDNLFKIEYRLYTCLKDMFHKA